MQTSSIPLGKQLKQSGLLFLKGMAMGAGDVVPGVSGGTIAFIAGIYEELIRSLRSIDLSAVKVLLKSGPGAAWRHINGTFLFTLFAGVLFSVFSLANLVTFALATYPILIWAFFFGLVCASIVFIARQLGRWRWQECVALAVGAAIALAISLLKPASLPADGWIIFLAGAIAICAMILPGISGSFILVLLGLYPVILGAVSDLNLEILLIFASGCALGLLSFSHFLYWLLRHYHALTLAVLTGFLVGSLNMIWPWKYTLQTYADSHGVLKPLVQQNVSPWYFTELMGQPAQLAGACVALIMGVALVSGLELAAKKLSD